MPNEQVITIRQPATANLMIDSADRITTQYSSPWDFQITKSASIMNGFFTRVATTEVVLEWCVENIVGGQNDTLILDISGATGRLPNETITLTPGFYTVAQALDAIVEKINDLSGTTGSTASVVDFPGGTVWGIALDVGEIGVVTETTLSEQLEIPATGLSPFMGIGICPDLRLYRYLDFVSSQLTYNQDLKDNSTASTNRDVLCRWYMAWDDQPQYDAYGFPILMGYQKFVLRRLFNPPKQIRWTNSQPLGNIAFQVYTDLGSLVPNSPDSEWLMTLQFSEN